MAKAAVEQVATHESTKHVGIPATQMLINVGILKNLIPINTEVVELVAELRRRLSQIIDVKYIPSSNVLPSMSNVRMLLPSESRFRLVLKTRPDFKKTRVVH